MNEKRMENTDFKFHIHTHTHTQYAIERRCVLMRHANKGMLFFMFRLNVNNIYSAHFITALLAACFYLKIAFTLLFSLFVHFQAKRQHLIESSPL